jgi:hypothetical protein
LQTLPMRRPSCLKYDEQGTFLAAGGQTGQLCVWNLDREMMFRPEIWLLSPELGNRYIIDVSFCKRNSLLVLTCDGRLHLVKRPPQDVLDENDQFDEMNPAEATDEETGNDLPPEELMNNDAYNGLFAAEFWNDDDKNDLVPARTPECEPEKPDLLVRNLTDPLYSVSSQRRQDSVDVAFNSRECIYFLRYKDRSNRKVWRMTTHMQGPSQLEFSRDLLIATGHQGCEIFWVGGARPLLVAHKYFDAKGVRGAAVLDRIGNSVSVGIFHNRV